MRAVTQAAGASVSAANYHFGSKEALLRATLRRRLEPVNRTRIARLDALEREAAGRPLRVEQILEAFLRPIFEEWTDPAARMRHVAAPQTPNMAKTASDAPTAVARNRWPPTTTISGPKMK